MSVTIAYPTSAISPKEFKDWFRGLIEGMEGGALPDEVRWSRVIEKVDAMSAGLGESFQLAQYQAQAEAMRKAAVLGPQTSAVNWPLQHGGYQSATQTGQLQNGRDGNGVARG